jgi:hypothetical protein
MAIGGPFWLIGYGELVWDRTITAFVPMSVLRSGSAPLSWEVLDRFRFTDESVCDAQIKELRVLGCSQVSKKEYGIGQKQE